MRFTDRVALITGASRGVGAAIAVTLAKEGCRIAAAAKTIEPNPKLPGTLADTVRMVEEAGSQALAVKADIRFEEEIDALFEQTLSTFGRIDYLINNAGAIFFAPVEGWSSKKFDLVMGVNVRASLLCSQKALPIMKKQGFGHILMMSPPAVFDAPIAGKGPYLISKFGMTLLARAIDEENKAHGIAASALWPVCMLRTAATEKLGMGNPALWRSPQILADATAELLAKDPGKLKFRAWLDEEVLRESGITDFSPYRCVPSSEPPPLSIQLIDPSWDRD